jgi:pimeloyl-ACP methyl ester carboxylesterase
MPDSIINGATLNYEVHGDHGPWVALMPGGRRALDAFRSLAKRIAEGGYRVLIHDRRNCGASEVTIGSAGAEHEMWSEDLHALLRVLGALPAYVGGSSSGCRMSIDFALRHPEAARGLLLLRPTGGHFAVERLTERYYGEYIRAAQEGGMAAVCSTAHMAEIIAARPDNRDKLMKMDTAQFIAAMTEWDRLFRLGADHPVIGASEAQLKWIAVPACVVPGNDKTHPRAVGETLAAILPHAELHDLMGPDADIDVVPAEDWDAKETALATILIGCLDRMSAA